MSAFKINADEIKQVVLALDLELDPDTWDDEDREALAREIRIRTKPMLIAANKMDTPEAQANWEPITEDPEYEHLTFVPVSAHAEKALKNGNEQGVLDYRPGDEDFTVTADLPEEKAAGLEQIREFVTEFGGTGVQQALETALFEELAQSRCSPALASHRRTAPSCRTVSSSPTGRPPRTSRTSCTPTSAKGSSTRTTCAPSDRSALTPNSTTATWSK